MKKIVRTLAVALAVSALMASTAFANGWKYDGTGWWYSTNNSDSTWYNSGWEWIEDGGIVRCYYFAPNGYVLQNTVTPDGYFVNADGAWIVDGVVQTRDSAPNHANAVLIPN